MLVRWGDEVPLKSVSEDHSYYSNSNTLSCLCHRTAFYTLQHYVSKFCIQHDKIFIVFKKPIIRKYQKNSINPELKLDKRIYQFTENNDVGNWLILLFEHCTNRIFNSLRILFYSSVDRVNIQNYWFFFIYVRLKHRTPTITNFKSPKSVVWQKPPPQHIFRKNKVYQLHPLPALRDSVNHIIFYIFDTNV